MSTAQEQTARESARAPRYPAKRAAIALAAARLFVQEGYERTSVDAIAAAAGVSKRTVYNHYADKEQLFLAVIDDLSEMLEGQALEFKERAAALPDLRARLLSFVGEVARTMARSPERAAVLRLILTEAPHFPALVERWRRRRVLTPLLIDLLTDPEAQRQLDLTDPAEAADHLSAVTFGHINSRSLFGLIQLTDAQIDEIAASGVTLFLRAYTRRS